jgi:type I restriction enzyme M protein
MSNEKIQDYISGLEIASTPEEVHATQLFARILVEDYGYPKSNIRTRPQWHVKARPSDTKNKYPVDIAIFDGTDHHDDHLNIVVECKKPTRKDGRKQLEDYLRLSRASMGVWFNGSEKLFIRKNETASGISFHDIPNIPKYGERLEDVGLYRRENLIPAKNLKSIFRTMRNFLAANAVGVTRDEVFAQQIINLIFCKIYDERFTKPTDVVKFRAGINESVDQVGKRIRSLFERVRQQYPDVIDNDDRIILDDTSLTYAVGELQLFSLVESDRDAIGEAFEVFIGPSLKGGQGQFFTPRNVVNLLVKMVDIQSSDIVVDPACGSGGFLIEALRSIWKSVETEGEALGWPQSEIDAEKQRKSIKSVKGIDKDYFLAKVAKAYMAIIGDGRGGVFCENGLEQTSSWANATQGDIRTGTFDVVLANPPFGKKLKITDQDILSNYKLGRKWTKDHKTEEFSFGSNMLDAQVPQTLFVERCLDLLKPGGRMGMILPESMLCNPSHRYVMQYIQSVARITAVVSFPEELFQPFTHAKACGVLIEKIPTDIENPHNIFMAATRWCGHDSRGLHIEYDDIPKVEENFEKYRREGLIGHDHLGFTMSSSEINSDVYLPKYYNPELEDAIAALDETHELIKFSDLISDGTIVLSTGDEVGKLSYGTGTIPFIRTSDIANWEIKLDPKHGLSTEIYEKYRKKQDVQAGDILMVRDGTYLVGTCAMVSEAETRIVYQSHIYKIRVNNSERIDPKILLAILSSPIVRAQIFSKRFTQDIIDTLGNRIRELILPVPKEIELRKRITAEVAEVMKLKARARILSRSASLDVASMANLDDDSHDDEAFLTLSK